ncbi:uncharacterized protein LOC134673143 [Cydia fagiglandana]|uniref:uncharacterized protein LOC134673143 n=1 Tax=Cydia fagiglandana TaxID=1458189 RepID=UPI002FEE5A88
MIVRNLRTTVESSLTPLKTTDYRKVLLLRKSHRDEYHNCSCVSVYTEGVMKLVARRADIGKNVEDDEAADMLLSSLPENVLVSGLETAGFTNTLTIEIVYAFPLQEDHRMSNVQTDYDISSAYLIKEKITKLLCSCCKRNGKAAHRCFVKRKREGAIANTEDNEDNTLCAAANLACPCQDVIVDRGAIVLLARSHEVLQEYNKKACLISVASGELLIGELVGKVSLSKKTCLYNVIFVPQLASNLFSVIQVPVKHSIVVNVKIHCRIYNQILCKITGNCFLSTYKSNGLYSLKLQVQPIPESGHSASLRSRQGLQSANAAVPAPMHLWYSVGVLGFCIVMVCMSWVVEFSVGVVFQYEHDVPSSCVPCLTGKMSVTSVPRLCIGCAAKPLELTHSDLLTRCKSALGMEPASC